MEKIQLANEGKYDILANGGVKFGNKTKSAHGKKKHGHHHKDQKEEVNPMYQSPERQGGHYKDICDVMSH